MTAREMLDNALTDLPEEKVRQVVEYAQFLSWQDERDARRMFGLQQLARAYADDEPEYSLDDIKEGRKP